jgi:septum formation protein
MLRRLSGRTHQVMTGVSARSAAKHLSIVETTLVTFARLDEEQIAWYVASGEGADKAGAYAIQGFAARFIPRIDGSYSNVVGLPIAALDQLIESLSARPRNLASGG